MADYRSPLDEANQKNFGFSNTLDQMNKLRDFMQKKDQFQQEMGLKQQGQLSDMLTRHQQLGENGPELDQVGKDRSVSEDAGYQTDIAANDPDSSVSQAVVGSYNKVTPGMVAPGTSAAVADKYMKNPLDAKAKADAERAALLARQNNFNTNQLKGYQHSYATSIAKDTEAEQAGKDVKNLIAQAMTGNDGAAQALPVIAARLYSHGQRINIPEIRAAGSPADIVTILKNKYMNKATGQLDPKFAQDLGGVSDTLISSAHQLKAQKAMMAAQQYATNSGIPLDQAYSSVTTEAFPQPQNEQSPIPRPQNVAPPVAPQPAPQPSSVTRLGRMLSHPIDSIFGGGSQSPSQPSAVKWKHKTSGQLIQGPAGANPGPDYEQVQ